MSFTVIANTETMPYLNWADQRRQNAASPGRLGRLCAADPGGHPPASRSYQNAIQGSPKELGCEAILRQVYHHHRLQEKHGLPKAVTKPERR